MKVSKNESTTKYIAVETATHCEKRTELFNSKKDAIQWVCDSINDWYTPDEHGNIPTNVVVFDEYLKTDGIAVVAFQPSSNESCEGIGIYQYCIIEV